jgi:hypothetical protein
MLPAVEPKEKLLNVFPVSIQQAERPGKDAIEGATSAWGAAGPRDVRRKYKT